MAAKTPVYLDYHSTTPCDARVVQSMLPTFSSQFGNAASRQHSFGWQGLALVERAREQVAGLIHCDPAEILFTSGATESDNLAIKGIAQSPAVTGKHIVTSVTEHKAVLDCCHRLEKSGFRVTYLPVGADGMVRLENVERAIGPETFLVTVMYANNEIGTINPVREIGALCKRKGVIFHCDAVQALPYLSCDVEDLGIDLLSLSAHKMYGPKGIGALYVRRRRPHVRLEPMIDGGGHERGLRSGTLNVSGAVGLGKACELVKVERERDAARTRELRDRLLEKILTALPEASVNGSMEHRLPNNLNISFPGVEAGRFLLAVQNLAVSSGAACSSASQDGSYVLKSLGGSWEPEYGSIRYGLGRFTTEEEIDLAAGETIAAVRRVREASAALEPDGECPSSCEPRGPVRHSSAP